MDTNTNGKKNLAKRTSFDCLIVYCLTSGEQYFKFNNIYKKYYMEMWERWFNRTTRILWKVEY